MATMTITVAEQKSEINKYIRECTKGVVQTGPFGGMNILEDESWADGNSGTKLLGCYEQELHKEIDLQINRLLKLERPKIVNIGCAEGYYAVGMGHCVPQATVWIVDSDDKAVVIARKAAAANGVILFAGAEVNELMADADFVICDCEGAETAYLNIADFPTLKAAHIIVECHDSDVEQCNTVLLDRFKPTHDIEIVLEGARNPNLYPMLWSKPSIERWQAVSEGRPCLMNWLIMNPRGWKNEQAKAA